MRELPAGIQLFNRRKEALGDTGQVPQAAGNRGSDNPRVGQLSVFIFAGGMGEIGQKVKRNAIVARRRPGILADHAVGRHGSRIR